MAMVSADQPAVSPGGLTYLGPYLDWLEAALRKSVHGHTPGMTADLQRQAQWLLISALRAKVLDDQAALAGFDQDAERLLQMIVDAPATASRPVYPPAGSSRYF